MELQSYLQKRFICFTEQKTDNAGGKYFVASCYDRDKKKQHNQVTKYNADELSLLLRDDIMKQEIWSGKHKNRDF